MPISLFALWFFRTRQQIHFDFPDALDRRLADVTEKVRRPWLYLAKAPVRWLRS